MRVSEVCYAGRYCFSFRLSGGFKRRRRRKLSLIGRGAEETVTDAPDFSFVIDVYHLIDGDKFREQSESGAGGVIFELGAIKMEALLGEGELLARDLEIFAFDGVVFA